ncbi:CcdB family protein [Jinshanibacter sp. LJY008]|uniref:Toxin CcdB n=1 Tax=Limnobaculum eriocheiris TaxID=2897391 RepID=A0A9X1SLB3_9GAMM|nr:CcdB family protein [Limnobaculum eriocheiris]MCD1127398.1 CcdB family protein [Limnobaculum eriocheiris]
MPKQFDVYKNPSIKTNRLWPFYLILQNDYFDDLNTRLIVPLVSQKDLNLSQTRITPQLTINGDVYSVFTPAITFIDANKIKKSDFVCNANSARHDIVSALDSIITNT